MNKFKTLSALIGIFGTLLTFYWYDWKLFVIIMLIMWANNIDNSQKYKSK